MLSTKDKLKILFISQSAELNNGAEKCLVTLLKGLDRDRFTCIVVLPYAGPLKGELDRLGVKNYVLPLVLWTTNPPIREAPGKEDLMERSEILAGIIEKEKIDIVHTNTSIVVEGAIAAMIAGRPHIWHLHEILRTHPWVKLLLPLEMAYRFMELTSNSIVSVSKALEESLLEYIGGDSLRLIYTGIESQERTGQGKIREELGLKKDDLLVCTAGPIRSEKGYPVFIDAAIEVLRKRDAVFISAGSIADEGIMAQLRKKISDANAEKHIKFLGNRNDMREIMREIDIYVVSSLTESFGLAAVEAMAEGKPVVSTRCGGPEEIVVDGDTGFLVPQNDNGALADAIKKLADDSEKRRLMGLKGKERFHRFFSAERFCKEFEDLYLNTGNRKILSAADEKQCRTYLELLVNIQEALNIRTGIFVNSGSWRMTAPLRRILKVPAKGLGRKEP